MKTDLALFAIFVTPTVLKLSGVVDWPWWVVLFPFCVGWVLMVVLYFFVFRNDPESRDNFEWSKKPDADEMTYRK